MPGFENREPTMVVAEARRRFAEARDSGRRRWLWPEIAVEDWTAALATIADVTRRVLAGAPARIEGDATALGIAGYTSGMGPLLGWWFEQGALDGPADVSALFDRHLRHNRARSATLADAAVAVADALAERSVRATVLKGMGTAFTVFPEPGTRVMSDIDLLVAPDARACANDALRSLGYVAEVFNDASVPQQSWRRAGVAELPMTLSYVHRDDPWTIDLQTAIGRRLGVADRFARLDMVDDGSRLAWPLSPNASMLPPSLQFLQLAVHAGCSLDSLSLLRQVELVFAARRGVDWSGVLTLAEAAGALGACYPALHFARLLAPDAVPDVAIDGARAAAPPRVRAIVAGRGNADIQNVERFSLAERVMWADGRLETVREVFGNIVPRGFRTRTQMIDIYRGRISRLWHQTVSL